MSSSSSSSSSAASAAAVFPPSPQTQTPPPLLVENLPPLNQLSPVAAAAAAPASEQLCYVHCHFCDTVLVVSVPTSSLFKTVTVRCGHCSSLLTVNMRGLLFPGTPTTTTNTPTAAAAVTSSTITNNTGITTPPTPAPVSSVNNNNGHQFHFPNPSSLNNLAPNPPHHQSILDEISSANPSLQLLEHQQQHGLISGLIPGGARNAAAPTTLPPPPPSLNKGANKEPSPRTNNAVVNRPPEKRQRVPSAYNRFIKDEIQRIKAGNPDISHREAFSTAAKNWAHFPHIHFGLMPPDHHGLKRTNLLPQDYQIRRDGLLKEEGLYAAAAANMGVAPY